MRAFLLIVLISSFTACTLFNNDEPIPAYLEIDAFQLTTNTSTEGSASHAIKDAWIYANDQPVAFVELPARVPVLELGDATIRIDAGIIKDGRVNEREIFPFYEPFIVNLTLESATTTKLTPSVVYSDNTIFKLREDFEFGNDFDSMSTTNDPQLVKEGQRSGITSVNSPTKKVRSISEKYALPGLSQRVYMEMDYRNPAGLVNIYIRSTDLDDMIVLDNYIVTLSKKEIWNKIYVDLTNVVSQTQGDEFEIILESVRDDSINSANFYWDNIKLIHF